MKSKNKFLSIGLNRGGGNDENGGGGAKDYMREQLPFLALPNETKKKVTQ